LPEKHNCEGLNTFKEKSVNSWVNNIKGVRNHRRGSKNYHSTEPLGKETKRDIPKKSKLSNKIKRCFYKKYEDLLYWLNRREHHPYYLKGRLNYIITTILIFIIALVGFSIFYSNATKLNNINLWIIKLSGVLILISLFFIVKYGRKIIKEVFNFFKRQRNWLKYLIIILILLLLWQVYSHKNEILDPVFEIYDKTNFTFFTPISLSDLSFNLANNPTDNSSSGISLSDIGSFFTGPEIDDAWVHNFMSVVNSERTKRGLHSMQELEQLNTIATSRFIKMMENPFISHYGADAYNVGEVVFYPEGSTEKAYAEDIQLTAPLHWDLLMSPMFSRYGYHIEKGETIQIIGLCSTTEIPGPNIDVKEFFRQNGCQTTTEDSIWLVIDMT